MAYGDQVPQADVEVVDVGGRPVRRCRAWEAEVAARFRAEVGDGDEVRLEGDAAWDFLDDRLPALSQGWDVHPSTA